MVKKALSYSDARKKRYKLINIKDQEFANHLGTMERKGTMLVFGDSGMGKTTYIMKVIKAICPTEKVLMCTPEEAGRHSFLRSLELNNMSGFESRFNYTGDHYDELFERLSRKRQRKVVVIDSIQVFFKGKKREDYYKLTETYNDTLFIGVSKVKQGTDKLVGAIADEFYWDCQNRVHVNNFKAKLVKSRCGGDETTPLIINQQKADERDFNLIKQG